VDPGRGGQGKDHGGMHGELNVAPNGAGRWPLGPVPIEPPVGQTRHQEIAGQDDHEEGDSPEAEGMLSEPLHLGLPLLRTAPVFRAFLVCAPIRDPGQAGARPLTFSLSQGMMDPPLALACPPAALVVNKARPSGEIQW
jgi:hypothetical protein